MVVWYLINSYFKSISGNVNQSVVGEQAYFAMLKYVFYVINVENQQ
jgi:hypothetical protein